MDVKTYTEACLKFGEDTKNWAWLRADKFYVTDPIDGWIESCDNARDGLDVAWAFWQPPEVIKQHAAEILYTYITAELRLGIDEGWSLEQFKAGWGKFLN